MTFFPAMIQHMVNGRLNALDEIPVDTVGTDFQRQVWTALRDIPAGTTLSYGEMASRLGRPDAPRAVGSANALNPISIVVPCHRLVGSNGALTGYGGGIHRKRWLLDHERRSCCRSPNWNPTELTNRGRPNI